MVNDTFTSLPIIDISPLVATHQVRCCVFLRGIGMSTGLSTWDIMHTLFVQDAKEIATVAQQLHDACCNVGFFYVTGHGGFVAMPRAQVQHWRSSSPPM